MNFFFKMSSYINLFNGYNSLSKENMKLHLSQENEQKLNAIDNIHLEKIQDYSNKRNRNNNEHTQNMQRLANERENNENKRNIERKLNE